MEANDNTLGRGTACVFVAHEKPHCVCSWPPTPVRIMRSRCSTLLLGACGALQKPTEQKREAYAELDIGCELVAVDHSRADRAFTFIITLRVPAVQVSVCLYHAAALIWLLAL